MFGIASLRRHLAMAIAEGPLSPSSPYSELPIPPERVSLVTYKVRYLIEQLVSIEVKPTWITKPHSRVVKKRVVKLVCEAAGPDRPCLIFALLICRKYFKKKAADELVEAELYELREVASEHIAKLILEATPLNEAYDLLLKRFSIIVDGKQIPRISAIELAADLHAVKIIATHNYQQCITAIWRGYYTIQYHDDGRLSFRQYEHHLSSRFTDHYDAERMKVPLYQNLHNLVFTLLIIVFYTVTVNKKDRDRGFDVMEGFLYFFTFGFLFDGISKIVRGDIYVLKFWHVYNLLLYAAFALCFCMRITELASSSSPGRTTPNYPSFDFLACLAPFLYGRQLLHLNFFPFFGTMIVVLEKMIEETAIFFLLLVIIGGGFLQSFIALDETDGVVRPEKILNTMAQAILQAPDFDFYGQLRPPYGIILFYLYTSIVLVLLLNILIALFNQAYSAVTDDAVDEFLGLFANKTLEYIRSPDENTYCPPMNLLKYFVLIPLRPFLNHRQYQNLHRLVMRIVFAPSLVLIASYESHVRAREIEKCRRTGLSDGEVGSGWDIEMQYDVIASGWADKVKETIPNVEEDEMFLLRKLERDIKAHHEGSVHYSTPAFE